MDTHRQLVLAAAKGYTPRTEQINGRDHLIVPVVALLEGVVHPMNAKAGPEFVSKELIAQGFERWENKPLFEGHPLVNGKPVRGDVPGIRDIRGIGHTRKPAIVNDALAMEAALDIELAGKRAPSMLARAQAGEPIEISVGVLVAAAEAAGTHRGRDYKHAWTDYDPDHLALLPDGIEGACSREMGCGVRAMQNVEAPDELYVLWPDASGNDDHGRGGDNNRPSDGHQPGDKVTVRGNNGRGAVGGEGKKGEVTSTIGSFSNVSFKDGTSASYHESDLHNHRDQGRELANKASSAAERRSGKARDETTHHAAQMSHEAAANLHDSVVKELVGYAYPPEGSEAHAHLEKANAHRAQASAHLHSRNALGRRKVNGYQDGKKTDMSMSERFASFMEQARKLFADETAAEPVVMEQNPGDQGNPDVSTIQPVEEIDMTKEQIVKFLESATPCQLSALAAFVEGGAKPAAAPVAEVKPEPTEAELKALADARAKEIADAVDAGIKADRAQREAADAKAKTIATLSAIKDQPFTAEELAAKTQAELDSLVKFSEKVAPKTVRAAVDFGAAGAPNTNAGQEQTTEVADPPSMQERILAARAKK